MDRQRVYRKKLEIELNSKLREKIDACNEVLNWPMKFSAISSKCHTVDRVVERSECHKAAISNIAWIVGRAICRNACLLAYSASISGSSKVALRKKYKSSVDNTCIVCRLYKSESGVTIKVMTYIVGGGFRDFDGLVIDV